MDLRLHVSGEKHQLKEVRVLAADNRVPCVQGCLMPVYSFSLFSPTLTANLGYSAANAQLLSVVSESTMTVLSGADIDMRQPPYILAALTTVSAGFLSDKLQHRSGLVMLFSAIGALGVTGPNLRYLLMSTEHPKQASFF